MDGHQIASVILRTCDELRRRYPGANRDQPGKSILYAFELLAGSFAQAQDDLDARALELTKEQQPNATGESTTVVS